MYCTSALMCHGLATIACFSLVDAKAKAPDKVLLTSVRALTLRKGEMTSARRVSAIPQLLCIGGSAMGLYDVDVMRCTNQGTDYDPNNVQWSCVASLPPEFKLGSTDVVCEGYASPDDPYILRGSCGVEYRLALTEAGEARYGKSRTQTPTKPWTAEKILQYAPWLPWQSKNRPAIPVTPTKSSWTLENIINYVFMGLLLSFVSVVFISIARSFFAGRTNRRRPRTVPRNNGGGGPGTDDDPPPPYDPWPPRSRPQGPPRKPKGSPSQASSSTPRSSQSDQGWRPGFWSGAAGGAAAGYMAGRASSSRSAAAREREAMQREAEWQSRMDAQSSYQSSMGSPNYSQSRYDSTGFGETRRR